MEVSIVYSSKHGHTKRYAEMLGKRTGLPVLDLDSARSKLCKSSPVIFMGWIHASHVIGYKNASRQFSVQAVCAVGLCDTGTLVSEVRKATGIDGTIPLFTLQGGMDLSSLKGADKLLISMLTKGLSAQKEKSEQDRRMLELLTGNGDFVCEENLSGVMSWIGMTATGCQSN